MSSKEGDLYKKLFEAYKFAHKATPKSIAQKETNLIWKEARKKYKKFQELEKHINQLVNNYNVKATTKKASNLLDFFKKVSECGKLIKFFLTN